MSELIQRLRRLRQQAGVVSPAPTSPPQPARQSIEELRRLLGVRQRVGSTVAQAADRELPGIELAPGLRLIDEHLPMPLPAITLDADFAGLGCIDPSRLLHFDTETTGLAGGTGSRAFMIGAADWHGGGLRIRQLLITELRGEGPMLEAFAEWLRPDSVLVSYNGRCFDAPLLVTRYRLSRRDNALQGIAHLDLLFPVRRRFRGVWENCRLATVEKHLLKIDRDDDLPGSQAPAAWLTWLRGGGARDLRRVLQHNRQDVISLADLAFRLAALSGEECDERERPAVAVAAGLSAVPAAAARPAGERAPAPAGANRG